MTKEYFAKNSVIGYEFEHVEQQGLDSPALNEPRMITLKQVRDLFYSLWNNSKAITRITETELGISKLWDKTAMLTFDD